MWTAVISLILETLPSPLWRYENGQGLFKDLSNLLPTLPVFRLMAAELQKFFVISDKEQAGWSFDKLWISYDVLRSVLADGAASLFSFFSCHAKPY